MGLAVRPLIPHNSAKPPAPAAGSKDNTALLATESEGESTDDSEPEIRAMESRRLNVFEMTCNVKTSFNVDLASLSKGNLSACALFSYDSKFLFPVKQGSRFEVLFVRKFDLRYGLCSRDAPDGSIVPFRGGWLQDRGVVCCQEAPRSFCIFWCLDQGGCDLG
jgi:hypothetical protein